MAYGAHGRSSRGRNRREKPIWILKRVSVRSSAKQSSVDFTKAIREYELVKEGDKVAVCISGGKDSMLMAKLFRS